MVNAILGKKLGMTQIFNEKGEAIPVTVVQAGPCKVVDIRTQDKNGYEAVQIGFEESARLKKPQRGHQKELLRIEGEGISAKTYGLKFLREVEATNPIADYKVGDEIGPDVFKENELVDVTGTSKGKGFAGVMKRHNFHGGPKTHGQSDRRRAPGSIGAGTTPGRVVKGMRMAGHMGQDRVTVHNLKVVKIDTENSLILIRGAVPGADGGLLVIRKAVKPVK
ncbi:MAG: 50S ribosomal protein L3 [Chloroflexi bacterium]|uniref:Large ribosomal subunit protein uL3 n=1 Tax=Candidatus Chlorohelix allophototropha TaxID=3003348 RepID=A0A8T7M0I9_9CHLR|nr:50S ribosomal protein L3 [Chloroflexota bacterium]WJW65628.1 50S ribosomal protein L3 [Chloroflexota bacterium L227-S17]